MLRDAQVLEQLPCLIRHTGRHLAAKFGGKVTDCAFESDVRVFPRQHLAELLSEGCIGSHVQPFTSGAGAPPSSKNVASA
jgi:hypothetical protein